MVLSGSKKDKRQTLAQACKYRLGVNLGLTLQLSSGAGVVLKPRVKLGDAFELFARKLQHQQNISLNWDYMMFNNNGSKIDGTSYGVGFKF